MTTPQTKVMRLCLFAVVTGGVWCLAAVYFRKSWSWPLSLFFGVITTWVLLNIWRLGHRKPAPFQLVLRLANDKGGDQQDDKIFRKLHDRFKKCSLESGNIQFGGFDTDGSRIWFYFQGSDEASVRRAIQSLIEDCRIREGSYFLCQASQDCASPQDGPVIQLGGREGNALVAS